MEFSKFDEFIKSNAKDELSAPDELSWDNMNFPLPPAKRKRRILPWFLFLLVGAGLTISAVWHAYRQDGNGMELIGLENSISTERQNNEADVEAGFSDQHEEPFRQITTDEISTGYEIESLQSTHTVPYMRTLPGKRKEQIIVAGHAKYQDTSNPIYTPGEEIKTEKNMASGSPSGSNDTTPARADISTSLENFPAADEQKSKQFALETLPMRPLLNDLRIDYLSSRSMEQFPEPSLAKQKDGLVKQEDKQKFLLLSIGMNTAQLDHSSPILQDAETAEWGNRYQISFEQEVKNNWFIGAGLAYHRIHSTFTFDKDLGTYINFSEGLVIRQTRHIFQNNYFDFISLNLGASKQFNLKSRWYTQISINFSPSYRLRHTGKLIDDTETIIHLAPGTIAQNKWIWNAEAGWSVSYRFKAADVFCGVNISQALNKIPLFLNNDNRTIQPRIFSLNLGIKRTL
ncbi:MAG: hypothetical protein ACKV1O_22405 [Saprospiraceae bacterium]